MEYEIIGKMFGDENPKSIFEVGCASGRLFESYVGDKIVGGLDFEVDQAKKLYPLQAQNFIVWNATEIPWPVKSKSYDIVFTVGTLLLIPNPFPVIKEMLRIAKDKIILAESHDERFDEYGNAINVVTQDSNQLNGSSKQAGNFYNMRITRDYKKVFQKLNKEIEISDGVGLKTIIKCGV